MRTIKQTSQFKRDLKRETKGTHRKALQDDFVAIVEMLAADKVISRNKYPRWRRIFVHPQGVKMGA